MSQANTTYSILAVLKVKPESRDWVLENCVKNLVEKSRLEEGTIKYELFEDPKEPGAFIFQEEYKSEEDFKKHIENATFLETIEKVKPHFAGVPEIKAITRLI